MKVETGPMIRRFGTRTKVFAVDGHVVGMISAARGQVFQTDSALFQQIGRRKLSTSARGSVTSVLHELNKKYGGRK